MRKISFTVLGLPKTWARVKTGRMGQKYKPKETADFQNRIRALALEAYPSGPPHDGPAALQMIAYFPIPISAPKYFQEQAKDESVGYAVAPDFDNLAKNIGDAIEGIVIRNDSRFTDALIRKRYSSRPRMEIEIWLLEKPNPRSQESFAPSQQLKLF